MKRKKPEQKTKRLLPLLASITLLAGPVLLVVSCDHDISRYPAALPNDLKNRTLFDFVNVNYSVDAKSQFNNAFKQAMSFITKEVEGVMAQQEFYNFFTEKLNYSKDEANDTFEQIKDNLGINLLANDYFNTVNSGQSFDNKVYATKLIFQTNSWHQSGTTKFDYTNDNLPFYKENNPNDIFTPEKLYTDLDDEGFNQQIKEVAKHADKNYNNEIDYLTAKKETWTGPSTPEQLPQALGSDSIETYQKKLERFKWWLRFRYQQYYYSTILPQLNETLFTMANVLDSILKITNTNNKPKIQIDNGKFAIQLQDWGPNSVWKSKYRLVWDYTTSKDNAQKINNNWNNPSESKKLPDLMENENQLNTKFFTTLLSSDKDLKNTVDPIFGINAFINDPSSKDYASAVKGNTITQWVNNEDGTHYWGKNKQGTFAYSAPIYWVDVVQNLDFNFYRTKQQPLALDTSDPSGLLASWTNDKNSPTSSTDFSKYMRGNASKLNNKAFQEMKWNTFWQMLYFISSQADTNPNKDIAKENFTVAAKALYPIYIPKNKIYSEEFWNAVSSYYP